MSSDGIGGMGTNNSKALIVALAAVGIAFVGLNQKRKHSTKYPYAARRNKKDTYEAKNGTKVSVYDPYHWLEDPDSDETRAWVEAENKVTTAHLEKCEPARSNYKAKMTEMLNYQRDGAPWRRGKNYYFYRNDGLQNHWVLYKQRSLQADPEVFIDPNKFSDDSSISLSSTIFSQNGELCAYMKSVSGSDWRTIHIKNVESGDDLPETLEWVKFTSVAWTHDHNGFFYTRYPKPDGADTVEDFRTSGASLGSHSIFYHEIGTSQDEDAVVYTADDAGNEKWMFGVRVTHDGEYLLTSISETTDPVNRLYFARINGYKKGNNLEIRKLVDNFDASYSYITNEDGEFWFKTTLGAPRYRVIKVDIHSWELSDQPFAKGSDLEEKFAEEIIPQHDKNVLQSAQVCNNNQILTCWMKDVKETLVLYNRKGEVLKDDFLGEEIGSIFSINTRKEDSQFFFAFSSFAVPSTVYSVELSEGRSARAKVHVQAKVKGFNPNLFITKQVFYTSKDGTRIPMFIVHKKGLVLDGNNPTLLYGYGGFSISITPYFSINRIVWMKHFNAVFAIANLRGGSEYGEEWHKGGCHGNKQNVFDDFHSAGEFLIDNKYTRPERLVIEGGSNGGLLVGACVNQRPDLYGCGIAHVGVMDMLKFHKFTIGYAWASDYGRADEPEHFDNLYSYSPLHNIKRGKQYPSFLSTTADHDDRVVPAHSFKHMAEMQYQLGEEEYQKNPLMIRIDVKAGHGAGKALEKSIDEYGDCYGFAANAIGAEWVVA